MNSFNSYLASFVSLLFPLQSAEDGSYEPLAPNQSPINPPYKTACELKKGSHVSQAGTTTIMNSDPTPGGDAATGTSPYKYVWTLKLILVFIFDCPCCFID